VEIVLSSNQCLCNLVKISFCVSKSFASVDLTNLLTKSLTMLYSSLILKFFVTSNFLLYFLIAITLLDASSSKISLAYPPQVLTNLYLTPDLENFGLPISSLALFFLAFLIW
jgi:hypothetical protein